MSRTKISEWSSTAASNTDVGGVNIAAGDTNIFASDQQHHFYRVRVKSTSSGNHATYKVYWNYVENL